MAYCLGCGLHIGDSPSCEVTEIEIRGRRYERLRYTTREDWDSPSPHTCPGCGIQAQNFHHIGCQLEKCPACEGVLTECECDYSYSRVDQARWIDLD